MRILIAEDEPLVARNIATAATAVGFVADTTDNGEDAWFMGSTEDYAAIILDLGLPRMDGMTVLKRWRNESISTPVIILSARGSWAERVEGIDSGADDYLPKPFVMQELLARLRAVTRRKASVSTSVIVAGALSLDLKTSVAFQDGVPVNLTPLEFRLLHHLAINRDRLVPKEELAEGLYAHNHEREVNAIEAIVSRLRRKLGPEAIESKRGFGYRFFSGQE